MLQVRRCMGAAGRDTMSHCGCGWETICVRHKNDQADGGQAFNWVFVCQAGAGPATMASECMLSSFRLGLESLDILTSVHPSMFHTSYSVYYRI